jgi:hypothetical protein
LSPPLWWLPALRDVDRLARDLVPSKLVDADPEVPRTLVVSDRDLRDPEIITASDLPELDGRRRRIVASLLAEVLNSDEALAGLRELENSVVVVHRVSEVRIAAGEMLLEHRPDRCLIHVAQIARFAARAIPGSPSFRPGPTRWTENAGLRKGAAGGAAAWRG